MTGDQRHTDHIATGQQLSLNSVPTPLYFLFSLPHIFLIQFYASPQTAHWLLPQTHKPTLQAKAKEPFFATALMTINHNKNVFYPSDFNNDN